MSSSPTSDGLVEVTMPQMGVSIAEATVVEGKKSAGDQVQADEPLLEISTDKAESEVPAPVTGRLADVMVDAGETVDVGTVLATIEPDAGEPAAAEKQPAEAEDRRPASGGNGGAPPVTPVVRRMAEEHDLDPSKVEGSGRRGRVTKKDVMAYMRRQEEAEPAPAREPAQHMESPYRESRRRPRLRSRRMPPHPAHVSSP